MSALGPCSECGTELAADQRYCVECGHRVAAPLAPTYLPSGSLAPAARRSSGWPLPIPMSMAGLFAAMALGFGVIAGTAISPNLSGLIAGEYLAQQDDQVAQAPPPKEPKDKDDSGGSGAGGGGAGSTSFGSGGFFGSSGGYFGGSTGGGGGGTKPKPEPEPKPVFVSGTVIHNNPVAGSYSVSSGGAISAIHTKTSPKMPVPGTRVRIPVRELANRTYAEDGKRQIKGETAKATFTGIVTDSRGSLTAFEQDTYTVSGHGASILVRSPEDPLGTLMPPGVGSIVTVGVEITAGLPEPPVAAPPFYGCPIPPPPGFPSPAVAPVRQLRQGPAETDLVLGSVLAKTATISTVVQATCAAAPKQFLLSSDDIRERVADIAPFADTGVLLEGVTSAQPILASVTLKPETNEVIEVNGTASDKGIKGADDESTAQGNLVLEEDPGAVGASAPRASRRLP